MRYLSTVALLATLTSGILAQSVGTFEAFPGPDCSGEVQVITVDHPEAVGQISPPAQSVKSHIQDCLLIIWDLGDNAHTVQPGDSQCLTLEIPGSQWAVQCREE